eukprot:m.59911 g.59911  ORF g.59911 m.59911 type:complete len:525 (-) comp13826_c0_seq1:35-1609(-)
MGQNLGWLAVLSIAWTADGSQKAACSYRLGSDTYQQMLMTNGYIAVMGPAGSSPALFYQKEDLTWQEDVDFREVVRHNLTFTPSDLLLARDDHMLVRGVDTFGKQSTVLLGLKKHLLYDIHLPENDCIMSFRGLYVYAGCPTQLLEYTILDAALGAPHKVIDLPESPVVLDAYLSSSDTTRTVCLNRESKSTTYTCASTTDGRHWNTVTYTLPQGVGESRLTLLSATTAVVYNTNSAEITVLDLTTMKTIDTMPSQDFRFRGSPWFTVTDDRILSIYSQSNAQLAQLAGTYAIINNDRTLTTVTTFDGDYIHVPFDTLTNMGSNAHGVATIDHVNMKPTGGLYYTCFEDLAVQRTTAPGFSVPTVVTNDTPDSTLAPGLTDVPTDVPSSQRGLGEGTTIGLFAVGAALILGSVVLLVMRRRMAHQAVVHALRHDSIFDKFDSDDEVDEQAWHQKHHNPRPPAFLCPEAEPGPDLLFDANNDIMDTALHPAGSFAWHRRSDDGRRRSSDTLPPRPRIQYSILSER